MDGIKNNEIQITITANVETNTSKMLVDWGADVLEDNLSEQITANILCATAKAFKEFGALHDDAIELFEIALDKAYEEASDA